LNALAPAGRLSSAAMTSGAGSSMVNVVKKARPPSEFMELEDIDAKHMGFVAQAEEDAREREIEKRRQRMILLSDCNEFRAVQAEMKKAGAQRPQQHLLSKPPKAEKRALPSFLKRPPDKRKREGVDNQEATEAGSGCGDEREVGSAEADEVVGKKPAIAPVVAKAPPPAKPAAPEPLTESAPGAGGGLAGLGNYDSDEDSEAASGSESGGRILAG